MDSLPLQFSGHLISSPTILLRRQSFPLAISYLPVFARQWYKASSPENIVRFLPCFRNDASEVQAVHIRDVNEFSQETSGLDKENGKESAKKFSSTELMQKLKRYGVAGVLSYGLLNTVYYLTTFLFVWFYFAPAPGRIGYPAAVKRFFKVMAMVWAGSQVTKVLRVGGALALCPFVDRGLSWFTVKFSFESEGKAFAAIAGLCFGLAFLLFLGLTMLWA
ncbi:uncharacterized protein LOC110094196 [Dendrobium catenatum]|uniref:uncharacterized protein LOC110094196 n=1 Tax=Dendrobium catenatum TaxID=906689 RepID=UPI0009F55E80|nr:uncharacterized protein LOC110094196 [Dendrobium catenatum]